MTLTKTLAIVVLGWGLIGCSVVDQNAGANFVAPIERSYDLRAITFKAKPDLRVSESRGYYPFADIVWRGDPPGDRIAQIEALFSTAAVRSQARLNGGVPIIADIELIRFHGVTDRTRASVGGTYNIVFMLSVRNAQTKVVIEQPRRIVANLDAPGGEAALRLEASGRTQKLRVTEFLTRVLISELSSDSRS